MMARKTQKSPAAHAYAQSLLELANESNRAEPMAQELDALREILTSNSTFRLYLADPGIGISERHETLNRIFKGNVSQLLLNFLGVLNEKGRLGILDQIIETYYDLLEEQMGKIEVDVYVAQKLLPEQLERVRQRVSGALKKDAVVHEYVDESLIGGIVLRVGDKLFDASAKHQLQAMKEKLLQAPIAETLS